MDLREFCSALNIDLTAWRARIYDIINHVETLPELDRRYFAPDISVLRAMLNEIESDVKKIKTQCPV
jgi:hypothetical protein